jgi:hypothetical protein
MFAAFSIQRVVRNVAIGVAASVLLAQQGSAETSGQISTRNIILAATAVTLGVVLYEQSHKTAVTQATVMGHTADGGVVYGDGRIVYPGGVVVYASNDGVHLCAYFGAGARCGLHVYGYPWRYADQDEWHGKGLHKGWEKGTGNPHHDQGDQDHD